jgi:AP-3 complex subunit beta
MILPGEKASALAKYAKKIFLATKPAPVLESKFKGKYCYNLHKAYQGPSWPAIFSEVESTKVQRKYANTHHFQK